MSRNPLPLTLVAIALLALPGASAAELDRAGSLERLCLEVPADLRNPFALPRGSGLSASRLPEFSENDRAQASVERAIETLRKLPRHGALLVPGQPAASRLLLAGRSLRIGEVLPLGQAHGGATARLLSVTREQAELEVVEGGVSQRAILLLSEP